MSDENRCIRALRCPQAESETMDSGKENVHEELGGKRLGSLACIRQERQRREAKVPYETDDIAVSSRFSVF